MEIREGLVPKWMADRLNGRDPLAEEFPVQPATAGINVSVSRPEKDQTKQTSSSPGGRRSSVRTNPKRLLGGRPLRSFPRAQARKLRNQGLSIRAISARMGVPASTVADALKVISRTKTE
jgi:hypothetical protein